MGKIWIPGGGDGADLDVITAASSDVRKGKVIVDKDGNPLTGIMAEIAAKTYTPGNSNQVIAANQFLTGAQTIKGDGNLNANNIVYGNPVFRAIILFMGSLYLGWPAMSGSMRV